MNDLPELTDEERQIYEWQMWIDGLGETGQRKLKNASVLISRVGGLGGLVAYELAAAGIGKLILAHGGTIKPSDLNRQLLMTHDQIGLPRIDSVVRRLQELNPRLEIVSVAENIHAGNAYRLVEQCDLIASCVPLFEERFLLNEEAIRQNKPMLDCAMYEMTGQLTLIQPGQTACVACRVPEIPANWKRQFPVLGAVSGTVGCLAAVEIIKQIAGFGELLLDRLLMFDLRDLRFRFLQTKKNPNCRVCGSNRSDQ